ncbi:hypothetical protein P3X46_033185 [Hevea brasiliensis]|uniref:RING-type E3 ubiquitin transferase n=1 Tax=Hevea brasiliensis TaxID=3981 RepID=A0ABQ9KH95_HEVBR|nr:E3 ubiquitin-protein ligase ATL41 [Hevea brasiliensis]KAJ9136073.1 hypothetical protein P3X46_033185 [Hevea brasiliensis]
MGSKDDDKDELGDSQKIMLAAIFSLFAVVLLIVFLQLYCRYLLNRQERRRRSALHRQNRQIGPDMESNVTVEPPKVGLDPLIVASFPTVAYKPTNQQELNHGEPIECSVCLGTIVEDAMVRILPNCKHMFHVECIDMWLGSNTTCPICRTVAEPRVQPVERELGSSEVQAQVQPSAPPLAGGSGSLFGSFRWMVTRERSSRARSCGDEVGVEDLERV